MATKKWDDKDPNEVLDYQVNWAPRLVGDDAIATSTFTVPAGLTKDDEDNDDTTTTVWLSGGTAGTIYSVLNRVTTDGGRTMDQTIKIKIKEK